MDSADSGTLAFMESHPELDTPTLNDSEEEREHQEIVEAVARMNELNRRTSWEKQALEELMWWMAVETLAEGGFAQTYVAENIVANTGCEVAYEFAQMAGLQWPPSTVVWKTTPTRQQVLGGLL